MQNIIQRHNISIEKKGIERDTTFKRRLYEFFTTIQLRGLVFVILFSITIPCLIYFLIIDNGTYREDDYYTCLILPGFRVNCGYTNISEQHCVQLDCCFDNTNNSCYHYLPSKYAYNIDADAVSDKYIPSHENTTVNSTSIDQLTISLSGNVDYLAITLHDNTVESVTNSTLPALKYLVNLSKNKLQVDVIRPENDVLLTTSHGPLMASNKYWEWTFYMGTNVLFGLDRLSINLDGNETMSKIIYKSWNDIDVVPLLWAYNDGKFHAVQIRHDGPLEVIVLASKMVVLRMIAGHFIELGLYVGPTPKEIHDQLRNDDEQLPFWMLKPQICR